jgi:hypothetical protein
MMKDTTTWQRQQPTSKGTYNRMGRGNALDEIAAAVS